MANKKSRRGGGPPTGPRSGLNTSIQKTTKCTVVSDSDVPVEKAIPVPASKPELRKYTLEHYKKDYYKVKDQVLDVYEVDARWYCVRGCCLLFAWKSVPEDSSLVSLYSVLGGQGYFHFTTLIWFRKSGARSGGNHIC